MSIFSRCVMPGSLLLALAFCAALAPRSQAQAPLPVNEAGKFSWGVSATFPPFESLADGKLVGFDVDLVEAVTARIHLQSAPALMEFKGLIPALLGGRIDSIISGMYINPERSQVVDFIPYLRVGDNLLVAKGNPLHLTGLPDLCGHRLAASVGTMYEKQAQAQAADCEKSGKGTLTLVSLSTGALTSLALKEGRVDALVTSVPTAMALIKDQPTAFEIAGDTFDNDTLLGWGFPKDKAALREAVDGAFKALVADGTYGELIKKYGLPSSSSLF